MGKGEYLGEFELVVMLSLARLKENAYGMTIHDQIHDVTGRDVAVPSVYVTLARLEKKGYVSSELGAPTAERGGRAKKFYRLEPLGSQALSQSLEMLCRLSKGIAVGALKAK